MVALQLDVISLVWSTCHGRLHEFPSREMAAAYGRGVRADVR
jgi:hypothetical protein